MNQEFVEDFSRIADLSGKIFLPDDFDLVIAKNIIKYIISQHETYESLIQGVRLYMNTSVKASVSIRDFASNIDRIVSTLQQEKASVDNFNKILEETKIRMSGLIES